MPGILRGPFVAFHLQAKQWLRKLWTTAQKGTVLRGDMRQTVPICPVDPFRRGVRGPSDHDPLPPREARRRPWLGVV